MNLSDIWVGNLEDMHYENILSTRKPWLHVPFHRIEKVRKKISNHGIAASFPKVSWPADHFVFRSGYVRYYTMILSRKEWKTASYRLRSGGACARKCLEDTEV